MQKCGKPWRMPKESEFYQLYNKTTHTITTRNGVKGCLFKGLGDFSSCSIFLPMAGGASANSLSDYGLRGVYLSSTPGKYRDSNNILRISSTDCRCILITTSSVSWAVLGKRYEGYSVRPVISADE